MFSYDKASALDDLRMRMSQSFCKMAYRNKLLGRTLHTAQVWRWMAELKNTTDT